MADGTRMQQRRATEAVWTTSNYVLAAGELGVTTDTGIIKIGNGVSTWTELNIAFGSEYLPVLGTAANSELLEGISSSGFYKLADATTAATPDKLALRDSAGRLKSASAVSSDDVVNYDQLVSVERLAVARTVSANFTLELTDVGGIIFVDGSSYSTTIVCTVPTNSTVGFPVGTIIELRTTTSAKSPMSIVPSSGVTVNGATLIYGFSSSLRLLKTSADGWVIVSVNQSPGPILRRRIKTGLDNELTNSSFVKLRLDGADSGTALFTNNADTLGTNQQYSSATDLYKCYCRRSGWYNINYQVSVGESSSTSGRIYCRLNVNDIAQHLGSGIHKSGLNDGVVNISGLIPLSVGDYTELWTYVEGYSATASISNSEFASSFFEWAWERPL